MASIPSFQLDFKNVHDDVEAFAYRYLQHNSDDDAMAAGRELCARKFNRANLEKIVRWKTNGRGITRFNKKNSEAELFDALQAAMNAKTERVAIGALCALEGVAIPVASAILTTIYPCRFTIIDFRALETLGAPNALVTLSCYLKYLDFCRDTSLAHSVSLRDLDRALWQASYEKSNARIS